MVFCKRYTYQALKNPKQDELQRYIGYGCRNTPKVGQHRRFMLFLVNWYSFLWVQLLKPLARRFYYTLVLDDEIQRSKQRFLNIKRLADFFAATRRVSFYNRQPVVMALYRSQTLEFENNKNIFFSRSFGENGMNFQGCKFQNFQPRLLQSLKYGRGQQVSI